MDELLTAAGLLLAYALATYLVWRFGVRRGVELGFDYVTASMVHHTTTRLAERLGKDVDESVKAALVESIQDADADARARMQKLWLRWEKD